MEKLYGRQPSIDEVVAEVEGWRDRIAPYMDDTTTLLYEAVKAGKLILVEGQLGTLRDPDHGIYPFPTSSSPLAGFAAVGAGVPPWSITKRRRRYQAVLSCVGAGPFVTELLGDEAEQLRKRGGDGGRVRGHHGAGRAGWGGSTAWRTAAGAVAASCWKMRCTPIASLLLERLKEAVLPLGIPKAYALIEVLLC